MKKKYLVSTDGFMESIIADTKNRKFIVSDIDGIHKVIQSHCDELGFIYKKDSVYWEGETVKFHYTETDDSGFEYVMIRTLILFEVVEA